MVGLFLSTIVFATTVTQATPAQNANKVIRVLTKKAEAYLDSGEKPRDISNYYFRYLEKIDTRVFEQQIVKTAHRNPFIDGYIRWQLTNFDVDLTKLSDVAYKKFLETLPKLPENPRVNDDFCSEIAKAAASERRLYKNEVNDLKQHLEKVNKQFNISKAQTIPAIRFRLWVIEQLQDQPKRLAIAHLESLSAVVSAGWPSKEALSLAEVAFIKINEEGGLPDDAQADIDRIASQIVGINRLSLVHVDISDEGQIAPRWQTTAIDEFALKKLLRLLRKTNEESDGFLGRDREPPVKSTS